MTAKQDLTNVSWPPRRAVLMDAQVKETKQWVKASLSASMNSNQKVKNWNQHNISGPIQQLCTLHIIIKVKVNLETY